MGTVNAADRGRTEWLWGPPFCELPCANPSSGVEPGRPDPPNVQGFWPDRIIEVRRDGTLEPWEWFAWDHTSATKNDPASFDINFHIGEPLTKGAGGWRTTADFMHINSVGFLEESRQVVLMSRELGAFYLIADSPLRMKTSWEALEAETREP